MHDFVLREIKDCDIEAEILKTGFDASYAHKAVEKFDYKNIKIYNLSPAQANIIKQTALSCGADCATHREVITGKIEQSDCILGGSVSEIKKIAEKLKFQPFGLKILSEKLSVICSAISITSPQPILGEGVVVNELASDTKAGEVTKSKIVGILNITENSFSDGGLYNDFESAKNHLLQMIDEGADIIDIGAESTKPYSAPVNENEQIEKLLPIVDFAKDKIPLSIDTRSAKVAQASLEAGAYMINDVSGLCYDEGIADVVAKFNCPVVIQHSKGTPENMQDNPKYDDLIEEIFFDLRKKIEFAKTKGIENIIVDAGIGFGKSRSDNFEIIRRVEEFKSLGYPVMLGISRKSFLGLDDNLERDIYTTIFNALAVERKVDYIRVHNVKMHKTMIDLMNMFVIR